ncbi:transporter substrate-binding domain-containing protein [Desulfovibrio mangrovi]|uniref:ATP-binding protein n=1 Tax=Desulfovibrio mangrovi TaxID=2976983 RepID=UPI0022454EFE|nr:transporter substrate-binding domain-containing protein [Desulfovibrio mangrovi]UZP67875.1 transporter substrate-binding domain-containing protein [Desulfovibrio mangrovi]
MSNTTRTSDSRKNKSRNGKQARAPKGRFASLLSQQYLPFWGFGFAVLVIIFISAFALNLLPLHQGWKDPLTFEERVWLTEHDKTFVVAATPASRPLEYLDEYGEYRGMVADYMHLLEERLHVKFKIVEPDNMKQLLDMAKNREIDMIAAFAGNPARIDYMQFTKPYLELPTVILVNKSQKDFLTLETMREKRMELALPNEYAVIDYIHKYYPTIHIQPVYNYLAALLHVSFDEIDATIISLPQASYFIEDKGITNLRVAGHTEFAIFNRIAVRSDWPILARIMQKGLDSITPAEQSTIYRRWVRLDQNYMSFFLQNKRFWFYVAGSVLFVIFTFVSIIIWNRTLQRRVQQRTEELKKELKDRMRMLAAMEQTEDGIFILDTQGYVEYTNPSFQAMTGYSEAELKGRHIAMVRSDRHDDSFYRSIWDNIGKGEVWRGQTTYKRKDGSLLEGDLSITPVLDDEGKVINIVEVVRDITEKLRMETRMRQSQKMEELGTLAGGIAHDFNNIIAAISGYAELALPSVSPDSRAASNLERIRKVAARAREMVNQILVFSRRREPERRRVELAPLIHEVLNLLRTSLPSTITIEADLQAEGTLMADPSQIHQIIMNLGTNAAYAMRETGGVLRVSTRPRTLTERDITPTSQLVPGRYIQLEVSDSGSGIPADLLNRIFDPFFTTKPQGEGTGMGLAMVHGIIGSMGGEITARSKEGKGTAFTLLLPLAGKADAEVAGEEEAAVHGQGRILLVDDEEDLVAINSQLLEDLGYKVTGLTDSRAALERVAATPDAFDLIVTDQTMPGLTGSKLAESVYAIRPDLPVILCTGYSEALRSIREGQHGIRKIMLKPFELAEFSRIVREVLDA